MNTKLKAKVDCALSELKSNTDHIQRLLEKLEKDTEAPPESGQKPTTASELEFAVDFVLEGLDPDGDSLANYIDDEEM